MNKAISELVLKKWYEGCKQHLECHSQKRFYIERTLKDQLRSDSASIKMRPGSQQNRWNVEPFVLAHEFLYLICNCEDRLKTIKRVHKPELVSTKGNINHWEILNRSTGRQQVIILITDYLFIDIAH